MEKKSFEEFKIIANERHKGKYSYDNASFVNMTTKIEILCKECGNTFFQTPTKHLQGRGCPKCANVQRNNKKRKTLQTFVQESNEVHKNKYDYRKTVYVNDSTKVCITCPEHGDFWKVPNKHLNGQGCPVCSRMRQTQKQTSNSEEFVSKANIIHNYKYSYDNARYINSKSKIAIYCNKKDKNGNEHGLFWQEAQGHLQGHGCPKCGNQLSNAECEINEFITNECCLNVVKTKSIISPYELDIFIPEKNVAIEFDGIIWHSEKYGKDRNYHLNKTEMCERNGIKLIHIFEDEWLEKKEIVKDKLKHILGRNNTKNNVYARKTTIREVDKNEAKLFLNRNHIQGASNGSIYLGAFFDNELVAVMSFKRDGEDCYELNRFATNISYNCVGFGGKLFKWFCMNYKPKFIKSFADRRWSSLKNMYEKIGFTFSEVTKPDYCYVDENKKIRYHKFLCRKDRLIKKYTDCGLDMSMTELEMTRKIGLYRIWNCGLFKYVWQRQ